MTQAHPNSADIEKWLMLNNAEGIGPVTFGKLLSHFGSPDAALGASAAQLSRINGVGLKTAEQIAATRTKFDAAAELELADKLGVHIIHLQDDRYPPLLSRIHDPPPVIYIKGTLKREDNVAIAMVGSRRCSLYGSEQASRFAYMLSSAGFTVCSGMARGIDTAAHQGALAAQGRTIAVQGCGLAKIFPPENKALFEKIAESGACVSELPLNFEPLAENFPPRNRIIAGLSLGVIIVESPINSGGMITAKASLEYNREVMAVPGKIDSPLSTGCHRLIKQGAKLVDCVEDVMEALGYIGRQLQDHVVEAAAGATQKAEAPLFDAGQLKLSRSEKIVYDCLGREPIHLEQVIAEADLATGEINAALISLQLKGLIRQLPGNVFLRR